MEIQEESEENREEMKQQESEIYRPPPVLYQLEAEAQKSCSFFCKVNN